MSNKLERAGFFDISPTCNPPSRTHGHGKENDARVPVLSLVQFSRSPFVTFGTVKLGSCKPLPLCIENSTEDAAITVTVDKIPSSKGFSVDQTTFTIPVSFICACRVGSWLNGNEYHSKKKKRR